MLILCLLQFHRCQQCFQINQDRNLAQYCPKQLIWFRLQRFRRILLLLSCQKCHRCQSRWSQFHLWFWQREFLAQQQCIWDCHHIFPSWQDSPQMFWIPKQNQNCQITYRESSWQNPNWSHQDWAANIIGINCIALINPTAPSNNSCLLAKLRRLMIIANTFRLSSKLGWNNSSRVSNISNIYCAFSYEQDNRTWTWPILHWLDISFHKFVFRHSTPLTHCPNNI